MPVEKCLPAIYRCPQLVTIFISVVHRHVSFDRNVDTGKCLFEKVKICFAYANTKKVEPAD